MQIVLGEPHDARDLAQEPAIDTRALVDDVDRGSAPQGGKQPPEPVVGRLSREELVHEPRGIGDVHPRGGFPEQTLALDFERAQRLQEGRFERSVDRHDLAGRFHLGAERSIRGCKLVERPSGNLHHDIVERRLERGRRLLRHLIRDLVKALADRDLRCDTRDRIPRRLGCECGAPRHARVHLDDEVRRLRLGISGWRAVRVERELHVAAAFDPEGADDPQGRRAEHLILLVGQRL